MTIDEAIALERQVAKDQRDHIGTWDDEYSKKCEVWAEEHEQIAKWLEELKDYQDKNKMVVRVDCDFENIDSIKNKIDELSKYAENQYNKAIDDVLKLPKYTIYDSSNEFMNIRIDTISIDDILKLKEQENERRNNNR